MTSSGMVGVNCPSVSASSVSSSPETSVGGRNGGAWAAAAALWPENVAWDVADAAAAASASAAVRFWLITGEKEHHQSVVHLFPSSRLNMSTTLPSLGQRPVWSMPRAPPL